MYSEEELTYIYDKTRGYCHICGQKVYYSNYIGFTSDPHARSAWEVEHSNPRARGGTDYYRNLFPACVFCNRSKGALKKREYVGG